MAAEDRHLSWWRRGFLKGVLATVAMRGLDLPSRYGFHLLVAAALGVEQAGRFYIVYNLMTTLSGLGRLGVDRALTRHVAMAMGEERPERVRPQLRAALMLTLMASAVVCLGLYLLAPLFARLLLHKPELATSLRLAILVIPCQNLGALTAGGLAGLQRVGISQMIYSWLWPGIFCVVALGIDLRLDSALMLIALSFAVTAIIGAMLLYRALPLVSSARQGDYRHVLLRDGTALFSLELTQLMIASFPALILGMLADSAEVGLFSLAVRIALLVNLIVTSVAALLSPRYALLHARADHVGLVRAARQAIGLSLLLAAVPVAVMLIIPGTLLGLFGPGYAAGAPLLRILAVGQLIAAATASLPEMLGMTGRMVELRRLNALSMALLLLTGTGLTYAWGMTGTAWAVVLSIAVNGFGALMRIRRELGLFRNDHRRTLRGA